MKFDLQGRPIIAAPWSAINGMPAIVLQLSALTDPNATKYLGWDDTLNELAWYTPSGVAWGAITGTLASQTDLNSALAAKAALAGATFTGQVVASKNYATVGDAAVRIAANVPVLEMYDSDAATDTKRWWATLGAGDFYLQLVNDAENATKNVLVFDRTANAIVAMSYGNATDNPAHTFYGQIAGTTASIASAMLKDNDGSWGGRLPHATYTSYESGASFTHPLGVYHVQGTTNGPGVASAAQYYNSRWGLGSDYVTTFAMDFAIPRTPSGGAPLPAVRFAESGTWGSWAAIQAGGIQNLGATIKALVNASILSYGSIVVSGAVGGWSGVAIDDGTAKPTFMGNGSDTGIYRQGSAYWSFLDSGASSSVDKPLHLGTSFGKPYVYIDAGGGTNTGKITISTSAASGTPGDGDIWIQRAA